MRLIWNQIFIYHYCLSDVKIKNSVPSEAGYEDKTTGISIKGAFFEWKAIDRETGLFQHAFADDVERQMEGFF